MVNPRSPNTRMTNTARNRVPAVGRDLRIEGCRHGGDPWPGRRSAQAQVHVRDSRCFRLSVEEVTPRETEESGQEHRRERSGCLCCSRARSRCVLAAGDLVKSWSAAPWRARTFLVRLQLEKDLDDREERAETPMSGRSRRRPARCGHWGCRSPAPGSSIVDIGQDLLLETHVALQPGAHEGRGAASGSGLCD